MQCATSKSLFYNVLYKIMTMTVCSCRTSCCSAMTVTEDTTCTAWSHRWPSLLKVPQPKATLTAFSVHQWCYIICLKAATGNVYIWKRAERFQPFPLSSLYRKLELSLVFGLVKRQGLSLWWSIKDTLDIFKAHVNTSYIYLYRCTYCLTYTFSQIQPNTHTIPTYTQIHTPVH